MDAKQLSRFCQNQKTAKKAPTDAPLFAALATS